MNEYTELASILLETQDVEVRLELNVAESSLRRGLNTAIKELEEVRAIMNLPDLKGGIMIRREKGTDNFLVKYASGTDKPKVRFTILPTTEQSIEQPIEQPTEQPTDEEY